MVGIIIILLIILLLVLGVILYSIEYNKSSDDFLFSLGQYKVNSGHITYNSLSHKFSFYNRTKCIANDINFEKLEANIHPNDLMNWQNWFSNIRQKKLDKSNSIIIKMKNGENYADLKWTFVENRKNTYVFSIKDTTLIQDNLETIKMYALNNDFNDLRSEIDSLFKKNGGKEIGCLIYVNLIHFSHIYERYGQDTAKLIISKLKYRFLRFPYHQLLSINFTDDNFLLFAKDVISHNEIKNLIANLDAFLKKPIEVEYYKLELNFSYGVSVYGRFSSDFNGVLDQAILAQTHAKKIVNNIKFLVYDQSFEDESKLVSYCNNEVLKVINNNDISIIYQPFVDLKKNSIWGFYVYYSPVCEDTHYKLSVTDVSKQATLLGKKESWLNNIYRKYLSHYLKRNISKRHHLAISLNPEDISNFMDVYLSDNSYSEIKLIVFLDLTKGTAILNNYYNFIENLKKLNEEGIQLGIIVNEKILKEYHQIFSIIDYVMFDIDITYNSKSKQFDIVSLLALIDKFKNYGVQFISKSIKDFNQANKVKENGVNIALGEFFGSGEQRPTELENKVLNKLEMLE